LHTFNPVLKIYFIVSNQNGACFKDSIKKYLFIQNKLILGKNILGKKNIYIHYVLHVNACLFEIYTLKLLWKINIVLNVFQICEFYIRTL